MTPPVVTVARARFDAAIFDLDGVLTATAELHAAAWREAFDPLLARRRVPRFGARAGDRDHVDGRPRLEGAQAFARARGIDLPEGTPEDAPGAETLAGVARRKVELFRRLLHDAPVPVHAGAVAFVRALRGAGLRTAVVSASRHAREVLEAARIAESFDVVVDGRDAAAGGLRGRPASDTLLAAAERLAARPTRMLVVDDAVAGVQAARAAGFGLVIGVGRADRAQALRAHGADVVVADLSRIAVAAPRPLPSALRALRGIVRTIGERPLALFLDYDGTLTPIVPRPELAVLAPQMRAVLERLARLCTLAVVSGRDLADVRARVGIEGLCYAGSHGFDIAAPGTRPHVPPAASAAIPDLDRAEQLLGERLPQLPGVLLDRKRFGLAVHYRLATGIAEHDVEAAVDAVLPRCPRLRKTRGKKVFELLPDMDWHKGKALQHLLRTLGLDGAAAASMYLGDDVTDENAFEALRPGDIGIVVMASPRASSAGYRLRDPDAVLRFLDRLAGMLERRGPR